MKKILPILAVLGLSLTACSGPSIDELREQDPEGHTACIHLGGSLSAPGSVGETNRQKAAEHAAAAATAQISDAVSTDAAGTAVIADPDGFRKACEANGFDFD